MTSRQHFEHGAHHNLKLGKKAHVPDDRDFKFSAFLDTTVLPQIPTSFGLDGVFPTNGYAMLGNDDYGDCVWAGGDHETMVLGSRGAGAVTFTAENALSDYAACTGFDPSDPSTDQGTSVRDAMKYRKNYGLADAQGHRHKIGAYLSINIANGLKEFFQALYIFETVGIGINFPNSAMDQFNSNLPWTVIKGSPIGGGHYVPVFSKQGSSTVKLVTWAKMIKASQNFLETYMDEAWCFISPDALKSGKTYRGFDTAALTSYMAAL